MEGKQKKGDFKKFTIESTVSVAIGVDVITHTWAKSVSEIDMDEVSKELSEAAIKAIKDGKVELDISCANVSTDSITEAG